MPSGCWAACQGLAVRRKGACQDSDPLAALLTIPGSDAAAAAAAAAAAGGPSAAPASSSLPHVLSVDVSGEGLSGGAADAAGSSAAGGAASSGDAGGGVAGRYASEGFVYAGHAALQDEGPRGAGRAGFVGRLTMEGDSAAAAYDSAGGSSSSSGGGVGGAALAGTPARVPARLRVRAIRVSWDGAVFLERLDLCAPLNESVWSTRASCGHVYDLAVTCRTTANVAAGSTDSGNRTLGAFPCPSEGAVRLRDGADPSWGRVEYCYGGQWGSVCQDGWDDLDASVVCRQLNRSFGVALPGVLRGGTSPPGPAAMRVWLQQVGCTGSEATLSACLRPTASGPAALGATDCGHRADAGAACSDSPPAAPGVPPASTPACNNASGTLRLVGGGSGGDSPSGRVEVCYAGLWGAVCEANWGDWDAAVACRQLGFANGRPIPADPMKGQPVWMSEMRCEALASVAVGDWPGRLTSCPFWGMEDVNCPYGAVAGLQCTNAATFPTQAFPCATPGALRLGGGPHNATGRLEVCHGGQWGTVCEDLFGATDALVACRQLGFASGSVLPRLLVPDGHPDAPVWMDNLDCIGPEAALADCPFGSWGVHDCSHTQLGFNEGFAVAAPYIPSYGTNGLYYTFVRNPTGMAIALDHVSCTATSARLAQCVLQPAAGGCIHGEDVAVACLASKPGRAKRYSCKAGLGVRLVAGPSAASGTLQVCHSGQWGTVCDEGWADEDAAVACRQLGFTSGAAVRGQGPGRASNGTGPLLGPFPPGPPDMRVWLSELACSARNTDLLGCGHSGWGTSTAAGCGTHSRDAGAVCWGRPS
ncbi:Deleted in malignant brain tumors 1 protein [Tetrabaena socialis]|uniref:Deleted in malignant brain tumors 1 protein n=1 Tax=Tetrabaena socialis TaxID=47790 RepID=A0A2J7ZWJ6_9CHLO|nr:Deleted in malignant brain tumors 1 protein [Tetrabaena socialis]|eukprot:PNH04661.1 Deleted in malignant brain tumors 1 protein [Tetrabaena socialis]